MPEISNIVSMSLSVRDKGLTRVGFGTMAILISTGAAWRTKRVTKLSDVLACTPIADFGSWSPAYIEVAAAFAQSPTVEEVLLINKQAVESTTEALVAGDAADSDWFGLVTTIRTDADIKLAAAYVSTRGNPTIFIGQTGNAAALLPGDSITKQLYDLGYNNAGVIFHKTAAGTYKLTVTDKFVALNSITCKVNGVPVGPVVFAGDSDATLALLAVALQATAPISLATVVAVVGAADNDRVIEIVANDNNTDVMITDYVCTLGAQVNGAIFEKVAGGAEGLAAAWMASRLCYEPGETTWKFGQLVGITADNLTPSQTAALELYNANHYQAYGSTALPAQGKFASGRFIDVEQGAAWIKVRMQEDVFELLQTLAPKKIPYTNKGIEQLAGPVRKRLGLAVGVGILSDDPAPYVVTRPVSQQDPADKAVRRVRGIKFFGTLAGAVHGVALEGELTF